MKKIGLCGQIASGKSEVEKILQNQGFLVVDLDIISHKFLSFDESVKNEVMSEFDTLDRKTIAGIIFSDENKKKKLEQIIHPRLKTYVSDVFQKNQDKKAVFISGALLFEAQFDKMFDKIIYIKSDKNIRLKRLMKRNNFSEKEALKRIESQRDNSFLADYIIENNSDINNLALQIDEVLKKVL